MTLDMAVNVIVANYREWVRAGLRMVNVGDVDMALKVLNSSFPFNR